MSALKNLQTDIKKLADPKKAKILRRFFKTGKGQYGEGDVFLGIMMPQQRTLVKKYAGDLNLSDIDKLIKSKFHEERLVGLLILVSQFQSCAGEKKQKEIYKFYINRAKYINNWDLVDLTAPKIVGAYLKNRDKNILYKLSRSKNLWERRIAILATFDFIYFGNPTETLNLAKILLGDRHDLIHKAAGWMLREVGKRCGQKNLTDFLNQYASKMPRTMLRYAIERLPEAARRRYLKA